MIRLHADQLATQLQKVLRSCYFLFGNDALLLQESQDYILDNAKVQKFDECFSVTLDVSTDWHAILSLCQERSLFSNRQILLVFLPDEGINVIIAEKMLKLTSILHYDMLLILRGSKLTCTMENSAWFQALSQDAVLVNCSTPEQTQLPRWVKRRADSMNLDLDDAACHMLCYCYEGNLLALSQALDRLSLLYPDGNLTLPRVETAVHDTAHFMPFHLIDAALSGKSKRTAHILHQLQLETVDPVVLLRMIQREVLLLLMIKRQTASSQLHTLFDRHKIWQNRRPLITQAIMRLTMAQLRKTVALMTKIELAIKNDYNYPAWSDLNALVLLLCGKSLPEAILNV